MAGSDGGEVSAPSESSCSATDLQATALDVLERLVEATYTRDRRRHLAAAMGIEKLRFLCRLGKDLGHLDERRYEHAARALDETGRLIGGWRKADEAAKG